MRRNAEQAFPCFMSEITKGENVQCNVIKKTEQMKI